MKVVIILIGVAISLVSAMPPPDYDDYGYSRANYEQLESIGLAQYYPQPSFVEKYILWPLDDLSSFFLKVIDVRVWIRRSKSVMSELMPESVKELVDSTYTESKQFLDRMAKRLTAGQNETVFSTLDKLSRLGEETDIELGQIVTDLSRVFDSGNITKAERLSDETKIMLIRSSLLSLEKEIEKNRSQADNKIEESLQKILKEASNTVSEENLDQLWRKVDSAKLETYRASEVMTKSLNSLSDIISSLFDTLEEIETRFIPRE